ncbi:MAG: hypothetical protein LBO80_07920 [Treponema sp.]|jgi:hypothetical protein|nr:hypothetical protein [Treponema sp.]
MKTKIVFICIFLMAVLSCTTLPEPAEPPAAAEPVPRAAPKPAAVPEPAEEPAVFDPGAISEEVFISTKTDVQELIQDLNGIIRAKNYRAWVSNLGEEYIKEKGSAEFLAETTAILMESQIQTRRKALKSLEDYFLYVVVPAHQNDRVDDIEFISEHRVKAFTVTEKGRLRLYDLENLGDGWKIVN